MCVIRILGNRFINDILGYTDENDTEAISL